MAEKIVMGYWDCPYCYTEKIKGTDQVCPHCGHQRDKDIKCYMDKDHVEYLSDEAARNKGKGADWICPYCDSMNPVHETSCIACGAPKEEAKYDYFHREDKPHSGQTASGQVHTTAGVSANSGGNDRKNVNRNRLSGKYIKASVFAVLFVMIVAGLFFALKPKDTVFIANSVNWYTTVYVDAYETVQESDWNLPADGRERYHQQEIYGYDKELDYYETVEKTRDVKIGSHTETEYEDNGDGTYKEISIEVDDYGTETYTEEVPVYKDVPIYRTKYYYDVDKWIPKREVTNSGTDQTPVYKEPELASNERESKRSTEYKVTGFLIDKEDKIKTLEVSEHVWKKFLENKRQKCKANRLGEITFPESE